MSVLKERYGLPNQDVGKETDEAIVKRTHPPPPEASDTQSSVPTHRSADKQLERATQMLIDIRRYLIQYPEES